MTYLTRKINTVGFREMDLNTYEKQCQFIGGDFSITHIAKNIVVLWRPHGIVNFTEDNLNLIIRYGKDQEGNEMEEYIHGNCIITACDQDRNIKPLSDKELRQFIAHQYSALLSDSGNRIVVIDKFNEAE